jgi:hypothetical protein
MCSGELVTMPSSNTENPHLEATDHAVRSASLRAHQWRSTRTEDLVAHVVLPDEVAQEFLVDTGLVDNLGGRSVLAVANEIVRLVLRQYPKMYSRARLLSKGLARPAQG